MLHFNGVAPIARGGLRNVYVHPADPSLLVKVFKAKKTSPWYKMRRKRYGSLIGYIREVREQLYLWANIEKHPPFIQKIVGLTETDLGPGIVVECVFGSDGRIAPTLRELIENGQFDEEARNKLEEFFDSVCESSVVAVDFNTNNLVYGYSPEDGNHFVLVDGIGYKALVPLEVIFPPINRMLKKREIRKTRKQVEDLLRSAGNGSSKSCPGSAGKTLLA